MRYRVYKTKITRLIYGATRIFFTLSVILTGSASSLCLADNLSAISTNSSDSQHKKIKLQLKWKHQFQFAGYYAALSQGYFEEAGYEVQLIEAQPGLNPIEVVLDGRADYGIANSELALYRMKGEPLVALAAIIQHSPIVLLSLKESEILSPQDLIGKSVMFPQGHYGANTLGLLLKEGIKQSQINAIPLSYNINDLVEGKVDAMVGYVTDQPFQLSQKNIDFNIIDPRTYGIDFYGDVLFTKEDRINSNEEEIEALTSATLKGWKYAIENPEEIIQLIIDQYKSERSYEELLNEAKQTTKLIVPKLVDLGHMNPGRWQHIADTFKSLNMTSGELDTNSFLYLPGQNRHNQLTRDIIQVLSIFLIIGATIIGLLFHFNKKLKLNVAEKTMYLTKANRELVVYTKQLKDKEEELHQLNDELEKRIITRTETINKINHDLSQEIQQRKERELSLQLLSKAIENSDTIVLIIDRHHRIEYASHAFLKLTGFVPSELQNQPIAVLTNKISLPFVGKEPLIQQGLSPSDQNIIEHEIKCKDADGQVHWLSSSISLLWEEFAKDKAQISHYVIIFEDVTAHKKQREKMEKMALYDSLTGLENRALFNKRLEKVIQNAKRNMVRTALLFIDIDNFKEINDSLGHKAGDHVLKVIADRLKEHVRQNDSIARISGDEFTVLLSDIRNYEDASVVTRHILKSFEEAITVGSHELFITVSIGISITPEDSMNMAELLNNADMAMYQAKQNGKNNYQFFSEDMNNEIKHKNQVECEIKQSLKQEDFFLVYQPRFKLYDDSIIGAEALIRWQYSENEVRTPEEFIPIAESSGKIIPLGKWILKQAFEDILKLHKNGIKHVKISVNISPRQLMDKYFVSEVRALFADHPYLFDYLELEITEQCFIDKRPQNMGRLKELKDLGISLTIDDFGTGYSSLSYLKRLPVNSIKLDRSFMRGLPNEQQNAEIARAVVAMAHELNLSVTAEGVEKQEQSDFLSRLNYDNAQGFLFEKPIRIDQLIERFSKQTRSTSKQV